MKIPKVEDIILDCIAILSMIFLLQGLVRLAFNGSYGLLTLFIGLALLVAFVIAVVALRKNRQISMGNKYKFEACSPYTA